MAKTIHWQAIPDLVHIIVHTDVPPSDEDWETYLKDVAEHAHSCRGILVYTTSSGPSTAQRAQANEIFKQAGGHLKVAIMTSSRLTLRIVVAVSWVLGNNIKAFSTRDFGDAISHLGIVDNQARIHVKVMLRQLARAAGQDIDAFADESSRFRRLYDE